MGNFGGPHSVEGSHSPPYWRPGGGLRGPAPPITASVNVKTAVHIVDSPTSPYRNNTQPMQPPRASNTTSVHAAGNG